MNRETIIVGVGCLFVGIVFILFRPQIFIFLNGLVRRDTKPSAWYQKLEYSVLLPLSNFLKAILPNTNFSFRQAYSWTVIASIAFWFVYSIILWLKISFPINPTNIFKLLKECLFTGLLLPIGLVLLTGLIHSLAKLFGSKGSFQKFFITYIAFNIRPVILYITVLFIWIIFKMEIALFFTVLVSVFLLFVPITFAIKTNYHFNWFASFFIGLFGQLVLFLSIAALLVMFYPSIING